MSLLVDCLIHLWDKYCAATAICCWPGRSVVLLAGGERSCRTCLDPQVSFPGSCLQPQQLQGAAWLFVSGYAAYQDGLLLQAVRMAKEVGPLCDVLLLGVSG
jgi:hypothetical protein